MIKIPERYLIRYLQEYPDNLKKMVFIAGPRQVGKTTLVQNVGKELGYKQIAYLNWDKPADRLKIRDIHYSFFQQQLANASSTPLIILDELHKYPKWKSYLKGYFDTFKDQLATLVTGSAKMDVYRRGGDSLLGRYWLLHLYPLTLREVLADFSMEIPKEFSKKIDSKAEAVFQQLLRFGGFPEPFSEQSAMHHRRWIKMRRERLLKEDLRDLSRIHDFTLIEHLMDLVIQAVGSTLSLNSLRENLDVSYNAVKNALKWLQLLYYCFPILPYSKNVSRALKKEAKYFLYDHSEVSDESSRFENLVAVHLKKAVDFWNDTGIGTFALHYVRDLEKREVDFLILQEKKPWLLIEAKLSIQDIPSSLYAIHQQLKPSHSILLTQETQEGHYQVYKGEKFWVSGASQFLKGLV